MLIAIPVFNGRVAPVFDWAGRLALAGTEGEPEERDVSDVAPFGRPAYLRRAGVDVLVCGGISSPLGSLVIAEGIELVPGIVGEVAGVLAAYRQGKLSSPRWSMPGWCANGRGRGAARRCGRRGRRGRGGGWNANSKGGVT